VPKWTIATSMPMRGSGRDERDAITPAATAAARA
jgi:hypothetical protein